MRKFWMSILIVLMASSFGISWDESFDATENFIIQGNNIIQLSIESYKEEDGLTPIVLSIRDLEILFWMDASGQVSEMRGDDFHPVPSLFAINTGTFDMLLGNRRLQFTFSEQNRVRTRMRLLNENLSVGLKLDRESKQVTFYIGDNKLKLNHINVEFREIYPGMYEIGFGSPNVQLRTRLIYWETTGNIYDTLQKSGPVDLGKSRIWAKKVS